MARRRLAGAVYGLSEGMSSLAQMLLQNQLIGERQTQQQSSERLNQLLNDFNTEARSITPDVVAKIGPERAMAQYQNLKRRLPKQLQPLLGQDPDFGAIDQPYAEKESGLVKDIGAITNPDDPNLTPGGFTKRAIGAGVTPDISVPSPLAPASQSMHFDDPEFAKLLDLVKGQKEGLLAKETREEIKNPLTGTSSFVTERQQGQPGFTAKTGLTPQEEADKLKLGEQAKTDVENLLPNQRGAARGAGMKAGAIKRAELAAELEQMGITGQQQTGALQLADDFEKASGDFFKVRTSLQNVASLSKQGTAAGDIGIIYNVMTGFDPGSHVLAGEQATAQNAAGVPERIRAKYNQLLSGERLTPSERSDFTNTMQTLYTAAKQDHDDRVKLFTGRAQQIHVPPSLVVREPRAPTGAGGGVPPAPAGWKYVPKPGGGWTAVEETP